MHHQFNIQQFYVLPTVYLCVLYGSHNKQRLFPYIAFTDQSCQIKQTLSSVGYELSHVIPQIQMAVLSNTNCVCIPHM